MRGMFPTACSPCHSLKNMRLEGRRKHFYKIFLFSQEHGVGIKCMLDANYGQKHAVQRTKIAGVIRHQYPHCVSLSSSFVVDV